jgi:hypothetical protein
MKVCDFEDKVWEIDRIRLVLRIPEGQEVGEYDWKKAADEGWSVTKYLESRIAPKVGQAGVVVIDGDGEEPHGRTLLRTARASYKK